MCLSPVSLTREIAGRKYTQVVPCGKCVECLKKEQNEFVVRCDTLSSKITIQIIVIYINSGIKNDKGVGQHTIPRDSALSTK